MTSTTAAGSAIAISTGTPATLNAAGYAALAWDNIGLVDKIGTIGKVFAKVEFQGLQRVKDKLKGSADHGALTPSMAYDETDAGQITLRAAADDSTTRLYPIRVTLPSGEISYFRGRVFGAPEGVEGADSIIMTTATIEICTPRIRVASNGTPTPSPTPTPTPTPTPSALSPNIFMMGDSRLASFYNDGTKNNKNAGNHLVVANTQMGQRMVVIGNTAVAGQRSDEYNSSTSTMAASSAGTLIGLGVVNDIAQGRTGADSWATVKAIIDAAITAGKSVIWHTEPGAEGFTSAQIGHRNTFNTSLLAYAAANPTTLRVWDFAAAVLVDPTSTTSIAFKTGYSYDGTHLSNIGARYAGADFKTWAATRVGGTAAVLSTLQTNNLVTNKQFATATGGSVGTGLTGAAPSGWSVVRTGTGGGAVSVSAEPNGNGNEVVIAATGSAAADRVQISQQILTGFALNDKVRALVEVAVDAGATNLKSVRIQVAGYFNSLALNLLKFDMQPITAPGNAAAIAYVDMLGPDIMTLFTSGATTLDRVDITIAAEFSGSGSATFRVRQPTMLKA